MLYTLFLSPFLLVASPSEHMRTVYFDMFDAYKQCEGDPFCISKKRKEHQEMEKLKKDSKNLKRDIEELQRKQQEREMKEMFKY